MCRACLRRQLLLWQRRFLFKIGAEIIEIAIAIELKFEVVNELKFQLLPLRSVPAIAPVSWGTAFALQLRPKTSPVNGHAFWHQNSRSVADRGHKIRAVHKVSILFAGGNFLRPVRHQRHVTAGVDALALAS